MDPTSRCSVSPPAPPLDGGFERDPRLLRLALAFYGAMLVAALAWRGGVYGEPLLFASTEAAAAGVRPGRDAAAGALAGLVLIAASRVWTLRTRAGAVLARELGLLLGPLGMARVAILALSSACAEEAFFRGALQPRVGLLPTSLIFGLAHLAPRRALVPWAPAAAVAGLVLGGLFEWTGNLLAPCLAHLVVNALNLRWLGRRLRSAPDP